MAAAMLIVLALAALQPAAAPTAAPACALEGISDMDLIALRLAMVEQAVSGTPRPASAVTTLRTIESKASACAPADRSAGEVAVARFSADAIGEKLLADGVDRTKVDQVIAQTDAAVLDAVYARRLDAPGVEGLSERVTAVAGKNASETTRKLLGIYTFQTVRATRAPRPSSGPVER